MAIATPASVTVSIASERRCAFKVKFLESFVAIFVSWGNTSENCGTRRTSSKVSPVRNRESIVFMFAPLKFYHLFFICLKRSVCILNHSQFLILIHDEGSF